MSRERHAPDPRRIRRIPGAFFFFSSSEHADGERPRGPRRSDSGAIIETKNDGYHQVDPSAVGGFAVGMGP